MQWTPGGTSADIEDRRSSGGGGGFGFGGGGGFQGGIGTLIILGILSLVFGRNLFTLVGSGGADVSPTQTAYRQPNPAQDQQENQQVEFVSFVLDDVQKVWDQVLPAETRTRYRHAKLVLFRDSYPSACGQAQAAIGPFYCPGDEKVYLDLSFFRELSQKFGAPGEFAQAYVIAHEIGHHVQKILGIEGQVRRLQQQQPGARNPLSVRLELQADCFAGIWANSTAQRKLIDRSDVAAAMGAAAAVGDDRIQRAGQGYVNPESFTHGSSAQRTQWFQKGLETGQVSSCNTFQGT